MSTPATPATPAEVMRLLELWGFQEVRAIRLQGHI